MIIMLKNIGDTFIIGFTVKSLDLNDPLPIHYKSLWLDLPTDYTLILNHVCEIEMINFINNWDWAGEMAEPEFKAMAARFGSGVKYFMP